jgi:hypothetical protein
MDKVDPNLCFGSISVLCVCLKPISFVRLRLVLIGKILKDCGCSHFFLISVFMKVNIGGVHGDGGGCFKIFLSHF